jgi:hypothetical protein
MKEQASGLMRVFERKELLEIIESAACEPLRGLVQYLIRCGVRPGRAGGGGLAQLTDVLAALGDGWRTDRRLRWPGRNRWPFPLTQKN